MKATWKGTVIAQSDDTVVVEGNHYFPIDALNREHVVESAHTTRCGWKGTANYYTVRVGDAENPNAAWYYATPMKGAEAVAGRVAFWKGVDVSP